MNPRYYQQQCLDSIASKSSGSYLISMFCGTGKTFTFSKIPSKGRILILAHREELVLNVGNYYDCPVGYEIGKLKSNGEKVVSASVQSIKNRLNTFHPDDFDIVIQDEAHHAIANEFKKVLDYFNPRLLLGFTATSNRSDGKGLDSVFEDIIFEYSIEQAINDGNAAPIKCKRVTLDYNLEGIKTSKNDFNMEALADAMMGTEFGIAQAYKEHAIGKTIIFGVDIDHCCRISEQIPGSKYLHGGSKDRKEVLEEFQNGDLDCLINCMLFTEGTDIPCIETVIIARPTQSESLYTQMAGRGTRLSPGKEHMLLIDCVDASGRNNLCSAPTLLGIDIEQLKKKQQDQVEEDLFGLPEIVEKMSDTPKQWIQNVKYFDLWRKKKKYKTHNVNYFKYPNGDLKVIVPGFGSYTIESADSLGRTRIRLKDGKSTKEMKMQEAFDMLHAHLLEKHPKESVIWNLTIAKKWGKRKATEKQMVQVNKFIPNCDILTRLEAACVINRKWG